MEQFISGELKKIFRVSSHTLLTDLTVGGKYAWQEEEEMLQEQLFISELFKDIQDAILLILHYRTMLYIYHIGCAFNLHSIINSGLIPGGQNSSKRQTVLLVDPRDKKATSILKRFI